MRDHTSLFDGLRNRPGMYVREPTFAAIAAVVLGYDLALDGGLLVGFRELLIARLGWGNNLSWDGHVLRIAFPNVEAPLTGEHATVENEQHAIHVMFDLIDELQKRRAESDGLKRIFVTYEKWLESQSWYRQR